MRSHLVLTPSADQPPLRGFSALSDSRRISVLLSATVADFPTSLRELVATYRDALTLPVPNAVDTTMGGYGINIHKGEGGHGTHGERGRIPTFGDDLPLTERMANWLERGIAYWRYEMERERKGAEVAEMPAELVELARELHGVASTRGATAQSAKTGSAKRAEDKAILGMKGDPIVVGLLFDRPSDYVRRLRERHNQDPHTGDRVSTPRPLTSRALPAPPDSVDY